MKIEVGSKWKFKDSCPNPSQWNVVRVDSNGVRLEMVSPFNYAYHCSIEEFFDVFEPVVPASEAKAFMHLWTLREESYSHCGAPCSSGMATMHIEDVTCPACLAKIDTDRGNPPPVWMGTKADDWKSGDYARWVPNPASAIKVTATDSGGGASWHCTGCGMTGKGSFPSDHKCSMGFSVGERPALTAHQTKPEHDIIIFKSDPLPDDIQALCDKQVKCGADLKRELQKPCQAKNNFADGESASRVLDSENGFSRKS